MLLRTGRAGASMAARWYTGSVRSLTEVAPGVLVTTSAYAMTTSTAVIGSSGGCLVIDPAVTTAELAGLAAELAGRGLRPAVGWSTHPHWDHVLWSRELGDAPRYAAPAAIAIAETERDGILDGARRACPISTWSWSGGCDHWTLPLSRGTGRRPGLSCTTGMRLVTARCSCRRAVS